MTLCDYSKIISKNNLEEQIYTLAVAESGKYFEDSQGNQCENHGDYQFRAISKVDKVNHQELRQFIHYSIDYLLKERGQVGETLAESSGVPRTPHFPLWLKKRLLKIYKIVEQVRDCQWQDLLETDAVSKRGTKDSPCRRGTTLQGLDNPEELYRYFYHLKFLEQESLRAIYFRQHHLLQTKNIFVGGVNSVLVTAREIMTPAIKLDADQMVLVHNHPSGNIQPSEDDFKFTRNIAELAKKLSIHFLDHLIIGDYFFSFRKEGLL